MKKKEPGLISIGIAVSLDTSLQKDYKVVTMRSIGSKVMLTDLGNGLKGGMTSTQDLAWKQMFLTSGKKETEEMKVNGYD